MADCVKVRSEAEQENEADECGENKVQIRQF